MNVVLKSEELRMEKWFAQVTDPDYKFPQDRNDVSLVHHHIPDIVCHKYQTIPVAEVFTKIQSSQLHGYYSLL